MEATEAVFIGLGSNLGDSFQVLKKGWRLLGEQNGVTAKELSPPFLSSPVGMTSNFWFTNAVGYLQVSLTPLEFLELLLEIEQDLGRVRDEKKHGYQDRVIDLDLLYFGSVMMDTPRLTIPHPHRNERLFVLSPMAAIAPDYVDPETGQPVLDMHLDLLDKIDTGRVGQQEITRSTWPKGP